jgi:hypothetical protein
LSTEELLYVCIPEGGFYCSFFSFGKDLMLSFDPPERFNRHFVCWNICITPTVKHLTVKQKFTPLIVSQSSLRRS